MKFRLAVLLFFLLASAGAHAAEYKSTFGFPFTLSDDWEVMQPGEVSARFEKKTIKGMGLTQMDPATARDILARIKSGKVEYYFEKKYSTKDFNYNISTQLEAAGGIATPANVKELCPTLPEPLAKIQGAPVKVKVCRFAKLNGIPYLDLEYTVPSRGITTIQRQIPFLPSSDFQIVGGGRHAGLKTVRAAMDGMTNSITLYVSHVWKARPPAPSRQAAMVKDAMHHFAVSVNARDFTDFYGYISADWQRNTTVVQLNRLYKTFMDHELNLLPLDKVTPQFEMVPQPGSRGMFFVKGYYPTRPLKVSFEFGFLYEPPNWKLVKAGIFVKTVH